MLKTILSLFLTFICFNVNAKEKVFSTKQLSNIYIQPSSDSPVIYPIEMGKELVLRDEKNGWSNVLDEKTGLVGWIQKDLISSIKPSQVGKGKDFNNSFKVFREKVLEMSKSIKDAISIETFLEVEHLGGAAAVVTADNDWFNGRRHANQAFQIYDLWKTQNQSPSFLAFKNEKGEEQFIILSGPHRPRYLKSKK